MCAQFQNTMQAKNTNQCFLGSHQTHVTSTVTAKKGVMAYVDPTTGESWLPGTLCNPNDRHCGVRCMSDTLRV